MKDITIPASRIRTELFMLLYCIIAANLVNIAAIIVYDTQWIEIITWQRFILFIAFLFYLITAVIRGVYYLVKKKTSTERSGQHSRLKIHPEV
jgi:hypothetical protein